MTITAGANAHPLHESLRRMGLIGADERPPLVALDGGVSSEIYRVELASGSACVKRALARLKVSAQWQAPVERNHHEVEWMRTANALVPGFVPRILGEDTQNGAFAMEFLDPNRHPVWKTQLRDGHIEPGVATELARRLARIHAASAGDPSVARRFASDAIFHAIRIEPYLLATARAHPQCARALEQLAQVTASTRRALVHGDVSPKNVLVGPRGPVLLDAECAWYGDPAFDAAFCLNHMLLKCLWRPAWRERYLACFDAFRGAYLDGATWEDVRSLEARAARLLPGLLLGRVDGKSPVEYVTHARDKDRVRRVATTLLLAPRDHLADVRDAWHEELAR